MINTLSAIIKNNKEINLSLLSEILSIPTFEEIETEIDNIDPLKTYKIIDDLNIIFGKQLKENLSRKMEEIEKNIHNKWPRGKTKEN